MDKQNMIVNDFNITFSTVNGSGSATANITLMRALFKMGIPVSGKNIFPSNIQGLPTFFTLRLSIDGYLARVKEDNIVVAMNPASLRKDIESLVPGGVLLYPEDIKLPEDIRADIILYPMPVRKLIKDSTVSPNLKDYIANMVYVGVLASLLTIDLDLIYQALDFHFKGSQKAIDVNYQVVKAAFHWAQDNLEKKDQYTTTKMAGTE
ncbi:MAG TPA: 2-oxoacid:acceptor oxidoreductase family protein, partial [Anaerolineaceae bacterium]|nr:2-oxoacid:acceptor oxidoreductase family protein [Anaerolineaceae bacterium]